ncbi:MAG: antirestriction protein ArdA, partial [Betaproteobacteria bacterium]
RDRFGNPVEEFEIQFIDGENAALFEACGINQSNLSTWFDDIEDKDEHEKIALYFLTGTLGYSLDDAMNKVDNVNIFQGEAKEAAEELFDECYGHEIPENLRFYFDMDKFAHDLEIGGDFNEFEYEGTTYTCTNANGI